MKLEVKNLVGLCLKKSKINFDHTLIVLTILYQAKSIIICIEATVHTVYSTHSVQSFQDKAVIVFTRRLILINCKGECHKVVDILYWV